MKYYLEDIQPITNVGREIKQMVENGDHCDGNIYWLIKELEMSKDLISYYHGLLVESEKELEILYTKIVEE
jgi:hypothetical protein